MDVAQPPLLLESAPQQKRGPFRPARLASVRERLNRVTLGRRFRAADAWAAAAAAAAHLALTEPASLLDAPLGRVLPVALAALAATLALAAAGGYRLTNREPPAAGLLRVLAAVGTGALVLAVGSAALGYGEATRTLHWAACTLLVLLLVHGAAWALVRRWRAEGRLTPNVVVVGATPNARRLIESALASREINVLGVFDDRLGRAPADVHGVPVLGDTRALIDHKVLPYVDRIVITVSPSAQARVRDLIERLRVLPNAVALFLDVENEQERTRTLEHLGDLPMTQVSGVDEDEGRASAKRVQDVVVSALALLLVAPVMAAVALAVKLDSPGPVFFRQRRYGFNNEPITILKFRSMRREASDPTSSRQVEPGDPRVTRVGRLIRAASLDELPQLFNVLSGEMALVGPRPHAIGMQTAGEDSARLVAEYAWRHRMKPGITGWAQINGSRGPVDTPEAVRHRVALDIAYIERQNLVFDLYILLMTLPRLLGDRQAVR